MKVKDLVIKYLLWILTIIILYVLSFFVLKNSINNYSQEIIYYKQDNDIDYKVYLKENNFFEKPYLEKDNVYITSLINNIDVDFTYKMNFDHAMSGKYKYRVKAIISADREKGSSGNYWNKEYKLYESELIEYNNKNYISFDANTVKIDYNYYNDILMKFKSEYNLSIYGNLKLLFEIENFAISDETNNEYTVKSISTLDVPLTQATIEIPIKMEANNIASKLESSVMYDNSSKYTIMKIASGVCFLLATSLSTILVVRIVRTREKPSAYDKTVRKILKTYDEIIVNVSTINLDEFNIVNVSNFNELLDAHSEVRQPINFMENTKSASFILINDKMAWRYIIKKDLI